MGSYAIIRTRVQNSAVIYILTTFSPTTATQLAQN